MPGQVDWKKGQYYEFRATTKIHVGLAETDLFEGEVFFFDGTTLILNETTYHVPALKGAWDFGWMVFSTDAPTVYRPQPAGITVGPAVRQHEDITATSPMTVQHEERVVSTRGKSGFQTLRSEGVDQGVVVHRFNEPTSEVVIKTASQVMQSESNFTVPSSQTMMRASDDLDRLFDDAPTSASHYPTPHITHSDEDTEAPQRRRQQRLAREHKERELTARMMMKKQENKMMEEDIDEGDDEEPSGEIVRTSVGIDWDLSPHWRKRAQFAITRYGGSQEILESIMEVEQHGVKKFIEEYLESRSEERKDLEIVEDEEDEIPLMTEEETEEEGDKEDPDS